MRAGALLLLGLVSACTGAQARPPAVSLACSLEVIPEGPDAAGLRFVLRNPGARPAQVRYFAPFTGFTLRASAEGAAVPIRQGASNGPVQPVSVTVAPGATAMLPTPVRLRFAEAGQPAPSGMEWHLGHAPTRVQLHAELQLAAPGMVACDGVWQP